MGKKVIWVMIGGMVATAVIGAIETDAVALIEHYPMMTFREEAEGKEGLDERYRIEAMLQDAKACISNLTEGAAGGSAYTYTMCVCTNEASGWMKSIDEEGRIAIESYIETEKGVAAVIKLASVPTECLPTIAWVAYLPTSSVTRLKGSASVSFSDVHSTWGVWTYR